MCTVTGKAANKKKKKMMKVELKVFDSFNRINNFTQKNNKIYNDGYKGSTATVTEEIPVGQTS